MPLSDWLPNLSHVADRCDGRLGTATLAQLDLLLLTPVAEFVSRPHKSLRTRLVSIGWQAATGTEKGAIATEELAAIIELLHAGSLITDDVQDGSIERRGRPAMHQLYGLGPSITCGNWLYFYPLARLRQLAYDEKTIAKLSELYIEAVERAHYGQALDVGIDVRKLPRSDVPSICEATARLKTGALAGMALAFGACAAGGTTELVDGLKTFGIEFGIALQMYDDLGNLTSERSEQKRYEDLLRHRPTFVWSFSASAYDAAFYESWLAATDRLPLDDEPIRRLLRESDLLGRARQYIGQRLESSLTLLQQEHPVASLPVLAELRDLAMVVAGSYV